MFLGPKILWKLSKYLTTSKRCSSKLKCYFSQHFGSTSSTIEAMEGQIVETEKKHCWDRIYIMLKKWNRNVEQCHRLIRWYPIRGTESVRSLYQKNTSRYCVILGRTDSFGGDMKGGLNQSVNCWDCVDIMLKQILQNVESLEPKCWSATDWFGGSKEGASNQSVQPRKCAMAI